MSGDEINWLNPVSAREVLYKAEEIEISKCSISL